MNEARVYVLRDSGVRERLLAALRKVEPDPERPYEVIVRPWRARRSNRQNARYWALLHYAAQSTGHSVDELHEVAKAKFIGTQRIELGERVLEIPMSSASLNTKRFVEYSEQVEVWLSEHFGVFFPTNVYYGD